MFTEHNKKNKKSRTLFLLSMCYNKLSNKLFVFFYESIIQPFLPLQLTFRAF